MKNHCSLHKKNEKLYLSDTNKYLVFQGNNFSFLYLYCSDLLDAWNLLDDTDCLAEFEG